jgi:hypothetical protein
MKFNYFLLILLLNVTALNAAEIKQSENVDYLSILNAPECQCYCSDLCGPRDKKVDDTPFYDEEFGVCFCKQRDKDNYLKNSCHLNPKQDFENCCKRPQEFKQQSSIQQPTIIPVNVPVK